MLCKIIIRLAGGLGNQIFQLGAGLLMAQNLEVEKIILDDSSLNRYPTKRDNKLMECFDFSKLSYQVLFKHVFILHFRIPKLFAFNMPKYPFVGDKNFRTLLKHPNKNYLILDGYFQHFISQQDFDTERKLLYEVFKHKNIEPKDGCVLHIRGGDFVKLGWHIVTPKEYYFRAIEIMKNEYRQRNFYVVTDDKEYSEELLRGLSISYEFIGGDSYKDFLTIGTFRFRILSSSTFAFWSSALGFNENSVVIAPKYWKPNLERKIFLPNEVRIEQ